MDSVPGDHRYADSPNSDQFRSIQINSVQCIQIFSHYDRRGYISQRRNWI